MPKLFSYFAIFLVVVTFTCDSISPHALLAYAAPAQTTSTKEKTKNKAASQASKAKKTKSTQATAKKSSSQPAKNNKKATTTKKAIQTQRTKNTAKQSPASATKRKASAVSSPKNAAAKKRKKTSRQRQADRYKGVVVYDVSADKILYSDKASTRIAPASLTKVLSMYVVLDAIRHKKISDQTIVTVSAKAGATGGSRMGLRMGDKVTLHELLRGMAVSSGNDASIAAAEFIAGSEQNFVVLMNRKAKELGMHHSVFKNASGLPAKGQYTTPNDMLILARSYLRAYPNNLVKYHNTRINTHKGQVSQNANPLLQKYPGADGLKTGFVNASGFNLIATAKRGTRRIIVVLMGCPTSTVRAAEITNFLDKAFGNSYGTSQQKLATPPKKIRTTTIKRVSKDGR